MCMVPRVGSQRASLSLHVVAMAGSVVHVAIIKGVSSPLLSLRHKHGNQTVSQAHFWICACYASIQHKSTLHTFTHPAVGLV